MTLEPPLGFLEARVLAVLVEKAATVPDSYPLSLNALVAGCNQKSARDPVIAAEEADVRSAADALRARSLVVESSGSRVVRYEHNAPRALGLPTQSVALLAALVLRGPQTAAELRAATERLHRFADQSALDGFLEELAARSPERGGPLVVRLPRAPGAREARWAHLLCGAPAAPAETPAANGAEAAAPADVLRLEVDALQSRIAALEARVQRLAASLGADD